MNINLGDVETTALIPVAIKANETLRKNPRVRDEVAVEMIKSLGIDTKPFDKFMSHEGVIARTFDEIKKLLSVLKTNFPNGTLIAEQNNPLMVKNQKYHDTVKNGGMYEGQKNQRLV